MEKENNLLRAKTLLSTVCFFCGDEISRQQYRGKMYFAIVQWRDV